MNALALINTAMTTFTDAVLPGPRNVATAPNTSERMWDEEGGGRRTAGQNVNGTSALTLSACWQATYFISATFGAMPCKAYRKVDDGREEQPNHPVNRIVSREPNPEMDSFVFWEMMTQWWVNYGNAFAEKQVLDQSGKLYALWPIHPTRMKPEKVGNVLTGNWIVRNEDGSSGVLLKDEVFNIVGPLSDDGMCGKGLLYYAAKALGVALAEQEYQGDFYANGGKPSGVLEHPAKLSPEARDKLRREWRTIHSGSNEVAILWEGLKFNPLSVDPEHAQLLESRTFSIQEVARFYDLPPHVLYELSRGTFSNVEEMNRFLVSHSLGKRIVRVEKACNRQLFTDQDKNRDLYVKFSPESLLRGNRKEQAEIAQIEMNFGGTSQDEYRALTDRNKLPEGQGEKFWMRRDMAPVDLVLKSAEAAPAETTPIPGTPPTPPTPPAPDTSNVRNHELRIHCLRLLRQLKDHRNDRSEQITELTSKLEMISAQKAMDDKAAIEVLDECEQLKSQLAAEQASHAELLAAANAAGAERLSEIELQANNMLALRRELEALQSSSAADAETAHQQEVQLLSTLAEVRLSEKELMAKAISLTDRLSASQTANETLQQALDAERAANLRLTGEKQEQATVIEALAVEKTNLLAKVTEVEAARREDQEMVVSEHRRCEHLAGEVLQASVQLTVATKARDEATAIADEREHQLQERADMLARAQSLLETVESERNSANTELSRVRTSLSALELEKSAVDLEVRRLTDIMHERDRDHEQAFNKVSARADELKSRVENLSTDLGTARAESETFKLQVETLTKSNASQADKLAAANKRAESAESEAKQAQKASEQAKLDAEATLDQARVVLTGAVRELLDQSLTALIAEEHHNVRTAARKADQFKEIINGEYHHFQARLTGLLARAAGALESLGASRVDTAKIAQAYVAESRTRLNNVFNKGPKDNLRSLVPEETKTWEGRKQSLLEWIN
jgi:HK97 family phage portal protein